MATTQRKALGRGLSALLGTPSPEVLESGGLREIDIDRIVPNTQQPRKHFGEEALNELADSIRVHGVIQPILLRTVTGRTEIVAGERRWRAAQRAGLLEGVQLRERERGKERTRVGRIGEQSGRTGQ